MIKFLERSKRYTTETEENSSSDWGAIRLDKDGSPDPKSRFNARKLIAHLEIQRQ